MRPMIPSPKAFFQASVTLAAFFADQWPVKTTAVVLGRRILGDRILDDAELEAKTIQLVL